MQGRLIGQLRDQQQIDFWDAANWQFDPLKAVKIHSTQYKVSPTVVSRSWVNESIENELKWASKKGIALSGEPND